MRQRSIIVAFIVMFVVTGFLSLMLSNASAADWRWLMGESDPVTGVDFCDDPMERLCDDAAVAANGDIFEMHGVGTLSVREDGSRSISGGGTFIHRDEFGAVKDGGAWEARNLLMFESYGGTENPDVPTNFRAGRALMKVKLFSAADGEENAVVELGCRIPGNSGIPGTIEGIRVMINGGPNFTKALDPRRTLFVDLSDAGGGGGMDDPMNQ